MLEKRKNRDIRNILAVLGAAVVCAVLLASVFLYYYGPSGRYLAGNTLLDPSIVDQISDQNQQARRGKQVSFTFDRIEFSYFEPQKRQMTTSPVSLETYGKFYKQVAASKSLEEVTKNIQDLFLQSQPALLIIRMHTKEGKENTSKVFQVVQFIPDDYFRVQLRGKNEGEWAYFYQAGLYQNVIRLFTQD